MSGPVLGVAAGTGAAGAQRHASPGTYPLPRSSPEPHPVRLVPAAPSGGQGTRARRVPAVALGALLGAAAWAAVWVAPSLGRGGQDALWLLVPTALFLGGPAAAFAYWHLRGWPRLRDTPSWDSLGTMGAALGALLGAFILFFANAAIDRVEPDVVLARALFMVGLAVATVGALGAALLCRPPQGHWGASLAGLALGAMYAWPAFMVATDYGKGGHRFLAGFGIFLAFLLALNFLVSGAFTALVASAVSRRQAAVVAAAHGVGACVGLAAACGWMLMNLGEQAEKASRINRAPAAAAVLAAIVILACAAVARRRTRA